MSSFQRDVSIPLAKEAIRVAVKCGSVESVNHAYTMARKAFPNKPGKDVLRELCKHNPVFKRVSVGVL
jgi:hypothetical protein